MNALAAVANSPTVPVDPQGLFRRVAAWMAKAPADARAQAVSALARAYLYSDISAADQVEAKIALTAALDDSSLIVRRALAEALASATFAPRHIVLSLAQDRSEVARVVLARSPVLTDADLVDCVALGDAAAQAAIARRPGLGAPVAAALAEVAEESAVLALVENFDAEIDPSTLRRISRRFGEHGAFREALLCRPELPASVRADMAAAASRALAAFTSESGWLDPRRAERVTKDAREQAVVEIASEARTEDLGELVAGLRESGTLTVALLLRSLMSGDRGLFARALANLSGVAERRVAGFLADPSSRGFSAVYAKAGMPEALLPAFRAALMAQSAEPARGDRLSNAITMRAIHLLERVETPAVAPVVAMLWRFAGESARADAAAYAGQVSDAPEARLLPLDASAFEPRAAAPLMLDLQPEVDFDALPASLAELDFAAAA